MSISMENSANIGQIDAKLCSTNLDVSNDRRRDSNLISLEGLDVAKLSLSNTEEDSDEDDMIYNVTYLGCLPVDRRYVAQVYQWVVREMTLANKKPRPVKVSMSQAFVTIDFEETINENDGSTYVDHPFKSIVRLSRLKALEHCFAYVVAPGDGEAETCYCHAFKADNDAVKSDFLKRLKESVLKIPPPMAANSPRRGSLMRPVAKKRVHRRVMSSSNIHIQDISSSVCKYSVYYVGKVTVSQPQSPLKFIDDVVRRLLKVRHTQLKQRRSNTLSPSKSLKERLLDTKTDETMQDNNSSSESLNNTSTHQLHLGETQGRRRSASDGEQGLPQPSLLLQQRMEKSSDQVDSNNPTDEEKSRQVKFQVSQSSVMLFSTNTKQLLLEKKIQDISYCTKGDTKADHFGFICRENGNHVCYVFFGETEAMVDAIMRSIKQAFSDALNASAHLTLCDSCPLQILHTLCVKLEGAAVSEQQAAVHDCSRELSEEEHLHLMNKLHDYLPENDFAKIKVIVALLRSVFGDRQKQHKHVFSAQVQTQPLSEEARDLRDRSKSTFFEKAKKSFVNPFESLKSRRGRTKTVNDCSADEGSSNNSDAESSKLCLSPALRRNSSTENIEVHRPRSRTFNSCPTTPKQGERFFPDNSSNMAENSNEMPDLSEDNNRDEVLSIVEPDNKPEMRRQREGSWRQAMYHSVISSSRRSSAASVSESLLSGDSIKQETPPESNPHETAKVRWQKAINEQILLIRMEKENQKLNNNIRAADTRRQKLSYKEYNTCTCESIKAWDDILTRAPIDKLDDNWLLNAVKGGVPKFRRGEVWQLLIEQNRIRAPDFNDKAWRQVEYRSLMMKATTHQHAILIDLGRTFPSHEYFTCQLGPGQISLFNLLKAYSSLDEEVGYCQGLSFVAGLLLMHMPEAEAFQAFCHVMYGLGIRSQYKPNMCAVRQQLYQWSRLLHDCHPAIHEHFKKHDVTPTLYAAPWFLTLFASQFPLGFSSRVMDLIFLQGFDVIFKVALVLVGNHAKEILELDGFEYIVDFLKTDLPKLIQAEADDVIHRAVDLEIRQQLNLYEAECQLLDEVSDSRERFEKQEAETLLLKGQVNDLTSQLSMATTTISTLRRQLKESEEVRKCLETASRITSHERDMLQLTVNALREDSVDVRDIGGSREAINNSINNNHGNSRSNGTMDRSWELVPSPSSIQLEMKSPIERTGSFDSATSTGNGYGCNGNLINPESPNTISSIQERSSSRECSVPVISVNSVAPLITDEDTY